MRGLLKVMLQHVYNAFYPDHAHTFTALLALMRFGGAHIPLGRQRCNRRKTPQLEVHAYKSGMDLVSWGAVMGAWIDPIDANNGKVTVVTKRRLSMNVTTTLTKDTFHKTLRPGGLK